MSLNDADHRCQFCAHELAELPAFDADAKTSVCSVCADGEVDLPIEDDEMGVADRAEGQR